VGIVFTTSFVRGSISTAFSRRRSPPRPSRRPGGTVLSVTGGTGAYRNSRGSMRLEFRNPAGTEFQFVFGLMDGFSTIALDTHRHSSIYLRSSI
jgi:hypothetical protein